MTNANNALTPFQIHELQAAAQVVGQPLLVVSVGTEEQADEAFAAMAERNIGAILSPHETPRVHIASSTSEF